MKRVYFFVTLFVVNLVISMNIIPGNNENLNGKNAQEVITEDDDHGVTPVSPKRHRALLAVHQTACAIQQQDPVTSLDLKDLAQDDENQLVRQPSETFLRSVASMGSLPLAVSLTDLEASLSGLRITSNGNLLAPVKPCHGVTPIKNSCHGVSPVQVRHDVTPIQK